MNIIDIGLPVSVSRMLVQKMQTLVPEDIISVRRIQEQEVEPLSSNIDEIPDLTTTHQISIMKNRDAMVSSGHYRPLKGLVPDMREDVAAKGFIDPSGLFTPICVVPLVIIYNRHISNPPSSWHDLLDPRWKGKINAPSLVILQKLMKFYAESLLGEEAETLFNSIVLDGLPIDVNKKVNEGIFDIGIVSLPFSRASRDQNVTLCGPEEGAFALPQVLIQKDGASKEALTVSNYLLSEDAQKFISDVGVMIPVNPVVPLPREVEDNNMSLYWKGWDWFISGINAV
jgi:ABC-type Fe3+ transport system substrate-binding protein